MAAIKLIACVLLLGVSACSVADIGKIAAEEAFKQIGSSKDTIAIHFNPVRFRIDLSDTANFEREFEASGYRVWQLRSDGVLRIEVQKLDTVLLR